MRAEEASSTFKTHVERRAALTVAVALGVGIALAGCSNDEAAAPCSPTSCPSGCCLGGECYQGTAPQACGKGGLTCKVCGTGQTCSNGACFGGTPTPNDGCSHQTCAEGCCDGTGKCVQPPSDAQCGASGLPCQACRPDQVCTLGACVAKQQESCDGCEGCCHLGTTCLPGTATVACGKGGADCEACADGKVCDEGTCIALAEPCTASNCAGGCCSATGECVPHDKQTKTACGKAGAACAVCPATATACEQGTCVDQQTCASFCTNGCCDAQDQCVAPQKQDSLGCGDQGAACEPCPAGTTCVDAQCVGGATWEIWAVSATIAPKKPDGSDWDNPYFADPKPDPYFGIAPSSVKWFWEYDNTSTVDDTLSPQWNEKVATWEESELLDPSGVWIHVLDDDAAVGTSDPIGLCQVVLTAANLQGGNFATSCESATALNLKFVKASAQP